MSSEQADAQIAMLTAMYAQDVEQTGLLHEVSAFTHFEGYVVKMLCLVVVIFGLVVCAMLRPQVKK